jgi:hypothetical protein
MATVSAETFFFEGRLVMGHRNKHRSADVEDRRFRSTFGTTAVICAILLDMLSPNEKMPNGVKCCHLLWALMFMKLYASENVLCGMAKCDEKTFRKWSWIFVSALAGLAPDIVSPTVHLLRAPNRPQCKCLDFCDSWFLIPSFAILYSSFVIFVFQKILWENRYLGDICNVCLVSVDGTDFIIQEPTPFWKGWHSRKFNAAALRYEIAISICSGDVVWINGPFPAGHWPDIKIFRESLIHELDEGEKVEADLGYRGEPQSVSTPDCSVFLNEVGKRQKELARSCHETLNGRLKNWHCLHDTFRHDLEKHGSAFRAVAVIVQVMIENGEPLFGVEYNDRQHYF